MNEGARQANADRERITAHTFADNQANRERLMLDKLDRMIVLLERIEANTRPVQLTATAGGSTYARLDALPTINIPSVFGVQPDEETQL